MFEIRTADLAGIPPSGWVEKQLCRILGAKTFHWLMFIRPPVPIEGLYTESTYVTDTGGRVKLPDWEITESIGKGTAVSRFVYDEAYIYRLKALSEVGSWAPLLTGTAPMPSVIYTIHSAFGDWPYDMQVNILAGLWWLLKHYLGIAIPVIHNRAVNCQEWAVLLCYWIGQVLGQEIKLIPANQYPNCVNIENSPYLEFIGHIKKVQN